METATRYSNKNGESPHHLHLAAAGSSLLKPVRKHLSLVSTKKEIDADSPRGCKGAGTGADIACSL